MTRPGNKPGFALQLDHRIGSSEHAERRHRPHEHGHESPFLNC
ncbi:hypothetical protein [Streptomyces sp. Ru73]|nr:hypothetical protein [Streptomyces sp. Ru73]